MRIRRFVGLVLLFGVLAVALPAASEAGVLGHGPFEDSGASSFFARLVQWVQGLFAGLESWTTAGGATPTGGG